MSDSKTIDPLNAYSGKDRALRECIENLIFKAVAGADMPQQWKGTLPLANEIMAHVKEWQHGERTTKAACQEAVIAAAQDVVTAWRADDLRRVPNGTPEENSDAQAAMVRLADALRGCQTPAQVYRAALEKAEAAMRLHGWQLALLSGEPGSAEAFAAWEAVDEVLHGEDQTRD